MPNSARALLSDLRLPIVSAPMAGASGPELARAVTGAGGLGMLGFGSAVTADQVRAAAEASRSAGPFGIGLMLWAVHDRPEVLEAALAARPALLSLSFGDPAGPVEQARAAGVPVAIQVGTLAETDSAIEAGVDLLVARGSEGGGHGRGEVATLPLLQQVLRRAAETAEVAGAGAAGDRAIPVLAAGGIGTARGVAAALAAGADGVWVGTPFAACAESAMAPALKARIIAADSAQTVYTRAFDVAQGFAWPAQFGGRAITNRFSDRWAERLDELTAQVQASTELTESMVAARQSGDVTVAPVYAGQSAGLVEAPRSAAEVMAELAGYPELLAAAARRWPVG